MTYTLTAELNGTIIATPIIADNDKEAMFDGAFKVMSLAYDDPTGPWGKGEIKLTDEAGNVVAGMDAK